MRACRLAAILDDCEPASTLLAERGVAAKDPPVGGSISVFLACRLLATNETRCAAARSFGGHLADDSPPLPPPSTTGGWGMGSI
jgi:hypothetical protein